MIELFHLIGLCPDSLNHTDLMDIIISNYNQIQIIIYNIYNKLI